jgi:hypothetical protein
MTEPVAGQDRADGVDQASLGGVRIARPNGAPPPRARLALHDPTLPPDMATSLCH